LSKKTKVIRHDLEAASKARNKLLAASSRSEDSKTIAELYDQMIQLEGVSSHLPILSNRLAALASQHVDAASWATRLQATEAMASTLLSSLTILEQAVAKTEAGQHENAVTMAENLKALDVRLQALGK
jgi:uncharacterized protein (DUF2235 family)